MMAWYERVPSPSNPSDHLSRIVTVPSGWKIEGQCCPSGLQRLWQVPLGARKYRGRATRKKATGCTVRPLRKNRESVSFR